MKHCRLHLAKDRKLTGPGTILYDILANDQVRPQEKDSFHLRTESLGLIAAGTVTTAYLLAIVSYHLLENPHIRAKCKQS